MTRLITTFKHKYDTKINKAKRQLIHYKNLKETNSPDKIWRLQSPQVAAGPLTILQVGESNGIEPTFVGIILFLLRPMDQVISEC